MSSSDWILKLPGLSLLYDKIVNLGWIHQSMVMYLLNKEILQVLPQAEQEIILKLSNIIIKR
jgi:hypothetical protein